MKEQENLYRVTYKNGNVAEWHAMSLILEDGKLYQASKMHPFDNVVPSVIDGSMIEKIECVEKNNHWDDRARLIQSAKIIHQQRNSLTRPAGKTGCMTW